MGRNIGPARYASITPIGRLASECLLMPRGRRTMRSSLLYMSRHGEGFVSVDNADAR